MHDLKFEGSSTDNQSFMALVRQVCENMGIRQKDLAASLDLKQSQMNLYFQGKVEMRTERLLSLLKVLGVDVELLLQDQLSGLKAHPPDKNASENRILALIGGLTPSQKLSMGRILTQLSSDRTSSAESVDGNEMLEMVKKELRRDHLFNLFCVLPDFAKDLPSIMRLSRQLGITPHASERYLHNLLASGVWSVIGSKVESDFTLFDAGDSSPQEFLSMTADIISNLNENSASNYDTHTLVTNRTLVRNFVGKVNQGLKELYLKSQSEDEEKNCIFSWAHVGMVNLNIAPKNNVESIQ